MPRVMVCDIETQNHKHFGAVASPRHPENYVVAAGWAIDEAPFDGEIRGVYYPSKAEAEEKGWLRIPDDVWLLVCHNAPFEMDWALHTQNSEIMKFLKRGGRVFCTMYAEYLLSNQQDTYPTLDETAPKYGGTHKVDGIKLLWQQGKLTSEIDKKLLYDEYLLGPGGDIENTRKVFYGQYSALQERGMLDMALGRMEGLLFNCFAMHAGLHIDRELAFKQRDEGEKRLAEIQAGLEEYRQDIPEYVQFKETSDYHMSAWLFGGPLKYRVRDVWLNEDGTPKYEKVDSYTFEDGSTYPVSYFEDHTENPVTGPEGLRYRRERAAIAAHGPILRYKSGKNKGQPKVTREDTTEPKLRWYDRVLQLPGIVDLGKLPKDVRESFEREFTGKRNLGDGSPVYSTGSDCIEFLEKRPEFSAVHHVLKSLLEYAKLDKDMSTYYLREVHDEEGNVLKQSGMLQYLTPENIVYHTLNAVSTSTGRLSSKSPNCQNIPRGDENAQHVSGVKEIFTSRFGEDGVVLEADYSNLETVVLASLSGDKNLKDALLAGTDMHVLRLANQLHEKYEEVLLKCKDEEHPEHSKYKQLRTEVKPKVFARAYGATAQGIAFSTGCSVQEAQDFIDAERRLFPQVESYFEDTVFPAYEATATRHREQFGEGQFRMYKRGFFRAVDGTCYECRSFEKSVWADGRKSSSQEFKPTQMRNFVIQGTAALFVQLACGEVIRWLISKDFFDGKALAVNTVHDAILMDVHTSVLPEVAAGVQYIMQDVARRAAALGYSIDLPYPVEVEVGESWGSKRKYKAEVQTEVH